LETARRQPTDAFCEGGLVEGKKLRNVDYGITWKASLAASKKDVARGKG